MNILIFLFAGLILSLVLAWRTKLIWQILLYAYWLIILAWALNFIHPFTYEPITWSKQLELSFSWHIDGISRLFTILISGIGLLIFSYAVIYSQDKIKKRAKLLALLQAFAVSMQCIVLTDNTLVLFLAWELTTVTSYLLIQFDVEDKKANQAAFNGMFISVMGGLAMLAGFILLEEKTHSWSIQATLYTLQNAPILSTAFWLLLLGAATKSAQFPFYFWLPGAMKAPTPVSAYLHSATMVNAGIYLLARFHPLFSSLSYWYPMLTFLGVSTMLISSILSLFQRDLKAILAYTTLFILGTMVYLLASDNGASAEALSLLILFHALYKAAAFMWVGTIDLSYGSRDIAKLRGVGRHWPTASFVAVVCFSAMAGLPLFYGFTVKEMLYEAKLTSGPISYSLMAIGIFTSMLIAATSLKCLYCWFVGHTKLKQKNKIKFGLLNALILAIIILALEPLISHLKTLLCDAANSIVNHPIDFKPINSKMSSILSIITVCGGGILFLISQRFNRHTIRCPNWVNIELIFEKSLGKLIYLGRCFTYLTQRQPLGKQLVLIFSALTIWLVSALYVSTKVIPNLHLQHSSWPTSSLCILLIITGISLLVNRQFLINMISLAVLGIIMSGIFVMQGAPDVAMTQLLIEILTVIIVVITLRKSTHKTIPISKKQKTVHGVLAILIGLILTVMLLLITNQNLDTQLSNYYINNSLNLAHGHNVVNVILVDFRAFDTLGEALVIFATALAIWLIVDKKLSSKFKQKECQ